MPYSRDQQIAARIALAARKSPRLRSKLKGAALSMHKSMSMTQLEDFAKSRIKRPTVSAR